MQEEKLTFVNCAQRIRDLCEGSGKNQKELARELGISEAALINYKRDRIPKAEELHRLATYFGVSIDWILTGSQSLARAGTRFLSVAEMSDQGLLAEDAVEYGRSSWQERAIKAEKKLADLQKALLEIVKKF